MAPAPPGVPSELTPFGENVREPVHAPFFPTSLPEHYSGDPDGFNKFVLECELYFTKLPGLTSAQKVSIMI